MASSHKSLSIRSVNHISRVCKDVNQSCSFYRDVLGFMEVKRPSSLQFEGAWLFNYGMGIHLIQGDTVARSGTINTKDEHISFQADCLEDVENVLIDKNIPFVKGQVEEDGVRAQQMFFHDPDHYMIEVCNCDVLPVVPLCSGSGSSNGFKYTPFQDVHQTLRNDVHMDSLIKETMLQPAA